MGRLESLDFVHLLKINDLNYPLTLPLSLGAYLYPHFLFQGGVGRIMRYIAYFYLLSFESCLTQDNQNEVKVSTRVTPLQWSKLQQ
jgi:hypothetical protein